MKISEKLRKLALASLLAASIVAIQAPPASAVACGASAAAQNGITVKPSHGLAFYVDFARTPKLDANFVGYSVSATSAKKNLWVKLSNFTGGHISLANNLDNKMQIAELATGSTKTTYFLLKSAVGSSTTDQIHKVEVFQGDPDVVGNTAIYSCDYTFTDIKDVIAANPNKVNSVSVDKTSPNLGDLVTVTVTGDTGTIGSGSDSPDLDVIWLSPTPFSTFQTRALRLESVTLNNTSSGRPGGCPTAYQDTLLVTSARTCFDDSNSSYTAIYRFRVIGASSTTVSITPNANISSGNPIKHTNLDPTKVISLNLSGISSANFKIKKEVTSNNALTVTSSNVEVPYRLTITTTSASTVSLDLIVDSATATASAFTTGSGSFTDVNRTGSPTAIVPETRSGSGKLYFVGPFYLNSTTPLVINYKMSLPVNGSTYRNEASAFIGDVEVSNTAAGEYRSIDVVVPNSCVGTCNITQAAVVAYSSPSATTKSATSVLTTSATIRGSFTTGGDPNTTVKFIWGTNSALTSGTTTVDLGIIATGGDTQTALSGLSAGTTYYYRINASNSISGAGGVDGEILSFITGAPTATTNAPDLITSSSARLNGSFTTGGGQNTAVTIRWGTDPTLATGTNVSIGTFTVDSDTSTAVTGLTPNTDYFYRIVAVAGALTANGEIVPFSTLGPLATTVAASAVTQTTATLNGTIGTGGGATTTPTFQYSVSPTLASGVTSTDLPTITSDGNVNLPISGLTGGTTYYFRVLATLGGVTDTGTILSFVTTSPSSAPAAPTTPSAPPAPVIRWSNPASIQYPTPLSATQLNAVATCKESTSIPGTYTYDPALGTVLPVGTHTLKVTWTPTFANDCTSLSTTVTIVVTAPAAPTITWANPASQVGPHTLGATQLNAVCSVPGTLTYDPAAGTVLQPGTYTLKVTCTPTDKNYPPLTTQVTFVVTKPTATITWNDPAPVAGPYTVDPSVLNSACSVPGTLTYDPATGTVLQPGTYTLKVTCTPTNTLYGPVSTSVTLKVVNTPALTVPLQTIPGVVSTPLAIPSNIANLNPTIAALGNGILSATIQGSNITYTPVNSFSGRSSISVRVSSDGATQIVQMPILVNPVAPDATKEPVTFMKGLIKWSASPNAIEYKVEIRGKTICTTKSLSCDAPQTVGPATPVLVTALGNDKTSTTVEAKYIAKKVLAFTVYFDIAKFNLKPRERATLDRASAIIKREGFSTVFIDGHTDSSPFDNQTLSKNRAKSTLSYVLKRVPDLTPTTTANAESIPAASNKTAKGKTLNRRAEGFVY